MSKGSIIVFLELNADCDACVGATGSLETHSFCAFILDCASLDPPDFIVARTTGDIRPTFAMYKSFRCLTSSSLRVICNSSCLFIHSSRSWAIAFYSSNLACNSCLSLSFLSKVSIVSEVWISISFILTLLDGGAAVGESAECDGPGLSRDLFAPKRGCAGRTGGASPLIGNPFAQLVLALQPSRDHIFLLVATS